jgi:hypothetical protein
MLVFCLDGLAVGRLVGTLLSCELGTMEVTVLGIALLLVVGNALAGLLGAVLPV